MSAGEKTEALETFDICLNLDDTNTESKEVDVLTGPQKAEGEPGSINIEVTPINEASGPDLSKYFHGDVSCVKPDDSEQNKTPLPPVPVALDGHQVAVAAIGDGASVPADIEVSPEVTAVGASDEITANTDVIDEGIEKEEIPVTLEDLDAKDSKTDSAVEVDVILTAEAEDDSAAAVPADNVGASSSNESGAELLNDNEEDFTGADTVPITSMKSKVEDDSEFDFVIPAKSEEKIEEKEEKPATENAGRKSEGNELLGTFVTADKHTADDSVKNVSGEDEQEVAAETQAEKTSEVVAAEAEWDAVQTITPAVGQGTAVSRPDTLETPLVSFSEVLQHIQGTDLSSYMGEIKTSISRRGWASLKHLLFGTKLQRDLHKERDLVFCVAACPFLNTDFYHQKTLQTIYKFLTGSRFDCQRYGSHWEQIGFQGNDPATDLRGTGFFSLLQMLYMISNDTMLQLARDIYKLSLHETQNFPFCLMGINISKICLVALREDCLNKVCNKRSLVMEMVNDFYVATFYHLYSTWKNQHKTIADTGFVLREVETMAKKNPKQILSNLWTHFEERCHTVILNQATSATFSDITK